MVIQVIVPPLPAELIVVSAGRLYGTASTTAFGGSGLFAGSVAVYYLGRYIHLKLARFFDRARTKQIIGRVRSFENVLLWVRILPYNPSDIISYAAGIVEISPAKFVIITACTSYVRVFVLATLGAYISDLKTLFQVAALLLVSALIGAAVAYGGRNSKGDR